MNGAKKKKRKKKDSITQQLKPTNQRQNQSLVNISDSTRTCSKKTKQSCRVKEKAHLD